MSTTAISIASNNSALAVPSSVTIASSQSSASFTATAGTIAANSTATITATYGGTSKTASITLTPPPPSSGGLVASYSFNEGSGSSVNDTSGNGNNGTINGATWTNQGKFGNALSFNGSNSLVVVNGSSSLNVSSAMTMEAWIFPTANQSGWRTIIQREVDAYFLNASNGNGPLFPSGGGALNGRVTYVSGSTSNPVNTWTHVALTYDGGTLRLYVNGIQTAITSGSGSIETNSNPLRIGGNVPYGEFFNGLIDEVRVYNRSLTQAEIQADMNTPIGGSTSPPPPPPTPTLSSLSCSPTSLGSGASASCTVAMSATATSNMTVSVSANNSNLSVPSSVTIPSGQPSASFTATAGTINSDSTATITATYSGASRTASINLVSAPATLTSLTCSPSTINSGGTSTCTITMSKAITTNTVIAVSDNSSSLTVPSSVTINSGQSTANFSAIAGTINTDSTATVTASYSGTSKNASISLLANAALISLSCSPSSLSSGASAICAVTMSKAMTSNTVVAVSDNSSNLNVPASVTVLSGQSTASFAATAGTITTDSTATVTASYSGTSKNASISLLANAALVSLSCSPSSLSSDASATCAVTMSKAMTSNTVVAVSDNSSNLNVPASVTVLSGQSTASFAATAGTITTDSTATVTASYNGTSKNASISLLANAALLSLSCSPSSLSSGASSTCAVTMSKTMTSNTVVTVSDNSSSLNVPSSVTIPTGQSSANFAATTGTITTDSTATVTASYNGTSKTSSIALTAPSSNSGGLVAAYSFNEGSGAIVTDASGNSNTGTISGATWITQGKYGKALSFNGSNNLVVVNPSSSLNVSSAMTMEAWIYPTANQSGWRTIIQREVDAYFLNASNGNGPLLPSGGGTLNGHVTYVSASTSNPLNTWTHIALTYDGASLRLYVNGIQAAVTSATGGIETNSNPLRIGGNVPYGEYFNGLIDEVRVYNRALTPAEIQSDMNTPIGGSAPPPPPTPTLSSLSCNPTTLGSGALASCTVTMSATATSNMTVSLSDNNNSLTVPSSVTLNSGQSSANFTATAGTVSTDSAATITAAYSGTSRTTSINLVSAPATLSSLTCSPSTISSGGTSTCTITMSKAVTANTSVTVSDNSSSLNVPGTVTVPSGQSSTSFSATAGTVTTNTTVTVSASYSGVNKTAAITIQPLVITLQSVSCPTNIVSGNSDTCTVSLTAAAAADTTVTLNSSSSRLIVPNNVTIRSGQSSADFTARARGNQNVAATVTAKLNGAQVTTVVNVLKSANLTIVAPDSETSIEGDPVHFRVEATDPDSQPVTVSTADLPAGAIFDATTNEFRWEPLNTALGSYPIEFRATSAGGRSATATVTVDVVSGEPILKTLLHGATRSTENACTPGALAALEGTGFGRIQQGEEVELLINGAPVEILRSSAREIYFQCPDLAAGTPLAIQAHRGSRYSNQLDSVMAEAAPGIFAFDNTGQGQGLVFHSGTNRLAMFRSPDAESLPAMRSDSISILATGLGRELSGDRLQVLLGDTALSPDSVTPAGPGIWSINLHIPDNAKFGDLPVRLRLNTPAGNALTSNQVTIATEQ